MAIRSLSSKLTVSQALLDVMGIVRTGNLSLRFSNTMPDQPGLCSTDSQTSAGWRRRLE